VLPAAVEAASTSRWWRGETALGDVPRYEDFAEPTPNDDEALVRMRAASLKNSDKLMADGSHYDSLRQLRP
jgi:NADPH:quinone reductase-like Zn-dependent oxidoreductase